MGISDLEMAARLGVAGVLGGLIGLEREFHHQPAGLRTHMIVSLGACLVMLVSLQMTEISGGKSDPGRIAAQVVAGVGFLGAGAIMRSGLSVRGLTTAACLWTVAGIGLAAGCGYWKAAAMTTFMTLLATVVLARFERGISKGRPLRRFTVTAREAPGLVGRLEELMEGSGLAMSEMDIQRDVVEKKLQVTLTAACPENTDVDKLSRMLSAIAGVEKVDID